MIVQILAFDAVTFLGIRRKITITVRTGNLIFCVNLV